jgi:hypothetical protein
MGNNSVYESQKKTGRSGAVSVNEKRQKQGFTLADNRPKSAVQRKINLSLKRENTPSEHDHMFRDAGQSGVIQRKLVVDGTDVSALVATDGLDTLVERYYAAMIADLTVPIAVWSLLRGANAAKYKRQLRKWIQNTPGVAGTHALYGRKQQNRQYANLVELSLGLTGWVGAKGMRKAEKVTATGVYNNKALNTALDGLLVKLFFKIHNLEKEGLVNNVTQQNILKELREGQSIAKGGFNADQTVWTASPTGARTQLGHYQRYHREKARTSGKAAIDHHIPQNQLDVLAKPGAYEMKDKIILLHDLMEYFGRKQSWNQTTAGEGLLPVETRDDTMVSTKVNASGERTEAVSMSDGSDAEKKKARGMGLTTATRDENAPSTKLARSLNLPVWAGQSMTTVRMMKLAQWAGATKTENSALAMGIFAYWRKDYDHTSSYAYHTMFEVLDVAKNFGVDYKMKKDRQEQPIVDFALVLKDAETKYAALVVKTQELLARTRTLGVGGEMLTRITAIKDEIKELDTRVKASHVIAITPTSTEGNKQDALAAIVINLEIAVEKQKAIKALLDSIPRV